MTTRRTFLSLALAAPLLTIAVPAFAAKAEVFADSGVAINGYDPVAYFTQQAPVLGTATHTTDYKGATWQFSSADSKALFDENPAKYAPQYGGYCAYAVSKGGTASTSPDAWTIYEDKLYLNYNLTVRGIWKGDIPGNISKADANWPNVLQ